MCRTPGRSASTSYCGLDGLRQLRERGAAEPHRRDRRVAGLRVGLRRLANCRGLGRHDDRLAAAPPGPVHLGRPKRAQDAPAAGWPATGYGGQPAGRCLRRDDPGQHLGRVVEQVAPAVDERGAQRLGQQPARPQVGADPGERRVHLPAVVRRHDRVGLGPDGATEGLVAEHPDRSRAQHGHVVDHADAAVVEQLRPQRVQAPAPAGGRQVERGQQALERAATEARHHDLDEAGAPRAEAMVAHRRVVRVVRRVVQRRRAQVELERRRDVEQPIDRRLAHEHVVVGQPHVVVVAPAVPGIQQLAQAGPLRPDDDVAHDDVRARRHVDRLKRAQPQVPAARLRGQQPGGMERGAAHAGDDEMAAGRHGGINP